MAEVHYINERNKLALNKPANTDQVYYSELKEWYTGNAFRSFSVKYVLEGTIYYRCGSKEYAVQKDHFLLSSKQPDVRAYFDSDNQVKSICIDICPQSVDDAFTVIGSENNSKPDDYAAGYFQHPHFYEQVHSVAASQAGSQLKALAKKIYQSPGTPFELGDDWFLSLTTSIVEQETKTFHVLSSINAKKSVTKKEILNRVLNGRQLIDDSYLQNPLIADIARNCQLSTFHFFRSFREAFGITPHQYLLQKRLKHAAGLLANKNLLLSEIAYQCGFPDLFSFSKAFKKFSGYSPSVFRMN